MVDLVGVRLNSPHENSFPIDSSAVYKTPACSPVLFPLRIRLSPGEPADELA
jgi:hypothetical protein